MIQKIRFLDALYTTAPGTHIPVPKEHEAIGFVTYRGDDVLIEFIRHRRGLRQWLAHKGFLPIVRGLVVPAALLVRKGQQMINTTYQTESLLHKNVRVAWRDVTHLQNVTIRRSHLMQSEGVLVALQHGALVLANPYTKRIEPNPEKEHAEMATRLVIPLGMVQSVGPV